MISNYVYAYFQDILRPVYEAKGFFGDMEPIEGCVDAVKEMSGMDG